MFTKQLYIGGKFIENGSVFEVINPATETVVGQINIASKKEANDALLAAQKAFSIWSKTSISERIDWMNKLRQAVIENEDHLRTCIHLEMGKNWAGTQEDFDSLVNSLHFYGEEITRIRSENLVDRAGTHSHQLIHQPIGVVVAFLAWNFPLLNLAFKIGPAMAAGCPIIIKPSLESPLSAYAVGELCQKIGLPAGVVNILSGDNVEIGDTLSSSKIPALLTLIGSTNTGKHIIKTGSTSIKRYSMELGGNAPVIVFADANLDLAADIVCAVKFGNAGQICVTPNRVFVDSSIADEFIKKVVERAKKVKIGFDKNQDIDMGPLINGDALHRVDDLVQSAIAEGARLEFGGKKPDEITKGHYYLPTVLSQIKSTMSIYQEEIFGPVVSIINYNNEQTVLEQANDTDTGLTAYVFTKDLAKADYFARHLQFGEVHINGVKYDIDLPHGGIKQSGVGHDCSHLALHDYLVVKRITRSL